MGCEICSGDCSGNVCDRCLGRMQRQLDDLNRFVSAASNNLVPSSGTERRGSERGLGVRLDALDMVAGFDVLPMLEDWEKDWRRFFGLTGFGPASAERSRSKPIGVDPVVYRLACCVAFIRSWLPKAAASHPAISDFAGELHGCWRQAQSAANAQPRTVWRVTCPSDTSEGECGKPIRITASDFDGEVSCRGCGTVWPVERLLLVVASSRHAELWLDPEAAARWLGISSRELRRWAQRGKILRKNGRYECHSIRAAIAEGISA